MKFPNKNLIYLFLFVFLISAGLAFLNQKESAPFEKLIIGEARQSAFGLLYIAKAKKFFREEGLEVSFVPYSMGRDSLTAAISGEVDLATTFQTPVVIQYLRGASSAVISTLHESNRNTALIARRGRGIERLGDLAGKKMGVANGTSLEFFAPFLLSTAGVHPAT